MFAPINHSATANQGKLPPSSKTISIPAHKMAPIVSLQYTHKMKQQSEKKKAHERHDGRNYFSVFYPLLTLAFYPSLPTHQNPNCNCNPCTCLPPEDEIVLPAVQLQLFEKFISFVDGGGLESYDKISARRLCAAMLRPCLRFPAWLVMVLLLLLMLLMRTVLRRFRYRHALRPVAECDRAQVISVTGECFEYHITLRHQFGQF